MKKIKLNIAVGIAGYLPVHAMCLSPPQTGYPYLKGQIVEYGQLVQRSSRCNFIPNLFGFGLLTSS